MGLVAQPLSSTVHGPFTTYHGCSPKGFVVVEVGILGVVVEMGVLVAMREVVGTVEVVVGGVQQILQPSF